MQSIRRVLFIIDKVSSLSGKISAIACLLLVVVIFIDVVARYFFNFSSASLFEMEWHFFSIIFLFGASYTLKNDKHVRVDIFYDKMSSKGKNWVNLIGSILFLIPFCWIILKGAIPYIEVSWKMKETSTDPGGLPFRYITKGFILIGFVLLFIQALGVTTKSFLRIVSPTSFKVIDNNNME